VNGYYENENEQKYPWAGMILKVSGCRNVVQKTKLQAEAIVMHFWKGSMPPCLSPDVIFKNSCLNVRQALLNMSTSERQWCLDWRSSRKDISHICSIGKRTNQSYSIIYQTCTTTTSMSWNWKTEKPSSCGMRPTTDNDSIFKENYCVTVAPTWTDGMLFVLAVSLSWNDTEGIGL
jgi:hypothetical protein